MEVEVRQSSIAGRESVCPAPQVSNDLPIWEVGVCVRVQGHTYVRVGVRITSELGA